MKNFIALTVLLLISSTMFGQEDGSTPDFRMPRALVKMAPMKFFERNFELGTEIFNRKYSRSFNLDLGFKSGDTDFSEAQGYSAEIAYRRYAPAMKYKTSGDRQFYRGIYYSLNVRGQYFEGKEYYGGSTNDFIRRQKTKSIAPGFTLGWQRTLWEALVLDIYVGGAVRFAETEYPDGPIEQHQDVSIFNPRYEGIMPKVGVKLGIGL